MALRFSSGNAASFSLRAASCSKAWEGFADVFRCWPFLEDDPARVEKETLVRAA